MTDYEEEQRRQREEQSRQDEQRRQREAQSRQDEQRRQREEQSRQDEQRRQREEQSRQDEQRRQREEQSRQEEQRRQREEQSRLDGRRETEQLRVAQDAEARRLEEQRAGQTFTDQEWDRRRWEAAQVSAQADAGRVEAARLDAQRAGHEVLELIASLSGSDESASHGSRQPQQADLQVAAENAKFFVEPAMWKAAPDGADILAAQGPFGNPTQNRVMYQTIGVLPLTVAAPTVSLVGAGYFLMDGSQALVEGNYERSLAAFATALALTPADAALNWASERSIHRAAWALQDDLERLVITAPQMRASTTIGVGVMSDSDRVATIVVSVNGGAQKSLVERVRAICRERGLTFVDGPDHAEVNIIRAAERQQRQYVRVTTSNYHCTQCQRAAKSARVDVALFSPDKGYVHRPSANGLIAFEGVGGV